jgi:hypothetical protein
MSRLDMLGHAKSIGATGILSSFILVVETVSYNSFAVQSYGGNDENWQMDGVYM